MLLNPKRGIREYPDEASRELLLAVIDFFESRGLARIQHDDHELWDVIAAKGFEKDMYFDMATRDIRALPKLEGGAPTG